MNPEMLKFIAIAREVVTQPQRFYAKKIRRIKCLNPKAKIQYHYERIHRLYFEGGGSMDVTNDDIYDRGAAVGRWCVAESAQSSRSYFTPERFAEKFRFKK